MKSTLFVIACVLASLTMSAQNGLATYHPLLKEGKAWNYQEYYHNVWNDEEWSKDVSYVINGTTEMDGKTYYKMYRVSEEGTDYYCALREEDRKVWQYSSDDGDMLIYDFNMSVGDSYVPIDHIFKLVAIKPVQVHDVVLNVYHYAEWIQYFPSYPELVDVIPRPIVEGVGCEYGWELGRIFWEYPTNGIIHREDFISCYEDGVCIFTNEDFDNLPVITKEPDYVPFIEDGKVWTVRVIPSWADPDEEQTEKYVEYYYFDGDTIVNGQTAKRMLYDRIGSRWDTSGEYIGAWYEQDKKVYYAGKGEQQFELLYNFALSTGDIIQSEDLVLQVTKMSSGIPGFKGTYYDLQYNNYTSIVEHWLEGVGSEYYPWLNLCATWGGAAVALLVCKAGDEIIYYNSEEEDPYSMGAKKHRFDFTHTIKTQPKAPVRREAEQPLYGEYNEQQLCINLNPLDDAYLVRIIDETGKVVYEKTIQAGNIVGLNIDISAYKEGRYTVTVENSGESFTGILDTQTTGIGVVSNKKEDVRSNIYNLQGQRISSLRKGLNVVNGRKVYVK